MDIIQAHREADMAEMNEDSLRHGAFGWPERITTDPAAVICAITYVKK
jgi:hypothetical protein